MSLRGAFSTMPLTDLLQWLSEARKSGTLTAALEFDERTMRFRDGQVVAIGGDDPSQRDLGQLLLRRGLVSEAMLEPIAAEQNQTKAPIGALLVERGALTQAALSAFLLQHAREIVLGCFLWREGTFLFSEGSPMLADGKLQEYLLPEPLGTRELLMEGMRRLDEWQRMLEAFPSEYTQVYALGGDQHLPIVRFLQERGEPVSIGELMLMRTESRFELYEQLYEAYAKGLIAVDSTPYQVTTKAQDSPVDLLLQSAKLLLDERQYEEAAVLLRAAENLDPYRAEVRELLRRAHDEQLTELYGQLPPYKIPKRKAAPADVQKLGPREQYLLSRISGTWDIGSISVMTPLGELETLKTLRKLARLGLVQID